MPNYSASGALNLNVAGSDDITNVMIPLTYAAEELDRRTQVIPAGTLITAPIIMDLSNIAGIKLIVVQASGEIQLRVNAETFDQTVKKLWVYDGTEVTSLNFGNTSTDNYTVKVLVLGD